MSSLEETIIVLKKNARKIKQMSKGLRDRKKINLAK